MEISEFQLPRSSGLVGLGLGTDFFLFNKHIWRPMRQMNQELYLGETP